MRYLLSEELIKPIDPHEHGGKISIQDIIEIDPTYVNDSVNGILHYLSRYREASAMEILESTDYIKTLDLVEHMVSLGWVEIISGKRLDGIRIKITPEGESQMDDQPTFKNEGEA